MGYGIYTMRETHHLNSLNRDNQQFSVSLPCNILRNAIWGPSYCHQIWPGIVAVEPKGIWVSPMVWDPRKGYMGSYTPSNRGFWFSENMGHGINGDSQFQSPKFDRLLMVQFTQEKRCTLSQLHRLPYWIRIDIWQGFMIIHEWSWKFHDINSDHFSWIFIPPTKFNVMSFREVSRKFTKVEGIHPWIPWNFLENTNLVYFSP